MDLNIHRFLPVTTVEGPGKRFCLWVQGCSIHCEGCGVPWTWSKQNGEKMSVKALFEEIKKSKRENNIEGVTFLGGEPFDQSEELGKLAHMVKEIQLTVMTFTGYLLEDLRMRKESEGLLLATDLLIDGPFKNDLLDVSRPWVGSSNQRYHFLTPVYRHIEEQLGIIGNKVEVRIYENGLVSINGMVSQHTLNKLFDGNEFRKSSKS